MTPHATTAREIEAWFDDHGLPYFTGDHPSRPSSGRPWRSRGVRLAADRGRPPELEHLFESAYPAGVNPNGSINGRPLAAADPYAVPVPQPPPVYHVWVNLSNLTTQVAQEYPGLVLGWRRTSDGYEAQVVYVVPSRTQRHSDASQIAWLPASKLKPRE